jgi:hypothetical protein
MRSNLSYLLKSFLLYLDAYDVGAVVGLGVGGAAVGVDDAAGVDVGAAVLE